MLAFDCQFLLSFDSLVLALAACVSFDRVLNSGLPNTSRLLA